MQKLADISSFESLMEGSNKGGSHLSVFNPVENASLDVSSNPDGSVSRGVPPVDAVSKVSDREAIPAWGNSLNERVGKLEQTVAATKSDLQSFSDRVDERFNSASSALNEVERRFGQVGQELTELKQDVAEIKRAVVR